MNRLAAWLDAIEALWTDEARARMHTQLLGVIAAHLGWDGHPDLEDPADILAGIGAPPPPADGAARAALIAAALRAAG